MKPIGFIRPFPGEHIVVELSSKTKINDLLGRYPFLLAFFLNQSPKFKLLQNPITRKTIGKVATMGQVASLGGLDLGKLLSGVANEIKEENGEEISIKLGDETVEPLAPESREARQEVLKDIIKDLHAGEDMAVLKQRFHDLVKDVDSSEIAAMEQGLIAEGMPEAEIKKLCDVHVEVFKESFEKEGTPEAPPGHPVNTFMLENRATEEIIRETTVVLDKAGEDDESFRQHRSELEQLVERLSQVDLHYLRKENQLFPILEGYGVEGPSQVMWAIHDDIRDAIKTARTELGAGQGREAINTIRYALQSITDMIYKEEHILFPMTIETLSEADWQKVRAGEEEIGYAWIEPQQGWTEQAGAAVQAEIPGGPATLSLDTGAVTPEQVNLILKHLPLELSFVDENDAIMYYSQVPHKIFPRSPGVIGRKVQNCHPPSSLDKVEKILDEFKSGKRDVADFWIEKQGRFIFIQYFAVRDANGTYKGTLEATQDATDIRALTGQQRLLDWE